ncbi:MAG TPA: plastocyanin/azurin family copper-binding protein [Solirubrobacteraceae bacterium]|nr:plastocyanin/azurin family copper-binding protein [Solirubrobacteraceae bacterium]
MPILITAVTAAAMLAVPAFAATSSVKVGDNYFIKSSGTPKLTVKKGTTVKWRWAGSAPHNVTASGPAKFHSKTQTSGSYSFKPTKVGSYKIICTIHQPEMKMTLVVK